MIGGWFRALIVFATAAWFAVATHLASHVTAGFVEIIFLSILGFGIAIAWFGATLACFEMPRSVRHTAIWFAVPAALFAAYSGFDTQWPLMIRVRLSEPELQALADQCADPSDDWDSLERRFAGQFDLSRVRRHGSITLFTTGHDWTNEIGIAYVPTAAALNEVESPLHVHPIYGPWYSFVRYD